MTLKNPFLRRNDLTKAEGDDLSWSDKEKAKIFAQHLSSIFKPKPVCITPNDLNLQSVTTS